MNNLPLWVNGLIILVIVIVSYIYIIQLIHKAELEVDFVDKELKTFKKDLNFRGDGLKNPKLDNYGLSENTNFTDNNPLCCPYFKSLNFQRTFSQNNIDEMLQLKTVKVKKTHNPEEGYDSKTQLLKDTMQHRKDVEYLMFTIADYIRIIGGLHDWSKIEYFEDFANDTTERLDVPNFKDRDWYHIHTVQERHHINANVPDKVNLFDLLEMICDCIIAGKTRSGNVDFNFLELNDGILESAYWNTVELISDAVIVDEDE